MKQVTFTKFTSTIQRDDLSKIVRDLSAVSLELLREHKRSAVPSLRTTELQYGQDTICTFRL